MKKTFIIFAFTAFVLNASSCFVFQRKQKYGCRGNGSNIGAEKLAAGDDKALRASSRAPYKGRKSF